MTFRAAAPRAAASQAAALRATAPRVAAPPFGAPPDSADPRVAGSCRATGATGALLLALGSLVAPPAAVAAPPGSAEAPAPSSPIRTVVAIGTAPVESLLEHVPADAVAVLIARRGALTPLREALASNRAMTGELSRYLVERLGADYTRIEGAVAYATKVGKDATGKDAAAAVFLRLPPGPPLRGTPAGDVGGVPLVRLVEGGVAARVPGGVLLGEESEVRVGIELAQGTRKALDDASLLGDLRRPGNRALDWVGAVHLPSIPDPGLHGPVGVFGLGTAIASLHDEVVTLSVGGDAARLPMVQQTIRQALAAGVQKAELEKQAALAGTDVAQGVSMIIAGHLAAATAKELDPRLDDGRLVVRYRLPSSTGVATVPTVGVLAAVAVPAFTRYVRKSKTAEARQGLAELRTHLLAYHAAHRKEGIRFAFPATTSWAPARACCGQPGDRCAPEGAAFAGATWKALGWAHAEGGLYQFRVQSQGKGAKASVVVEARGDLDCDGTFATFRLQGRIGADGELDFGELAVQDELE